MVTQNSINIGTGTTVGAPLVSAGTGLASIFSPTLTITASAVTAGINTGGSQIGYIATNLDNSNAGSHAFSQALVAGTTGGCPFFLWQAGTARAYSLGINAPASGQPLRLTTNTGGPVNPISGTEIFSITNAGAVKFANAFTFPVTDGSANQVLKTNGSGTVSWGSDVGTVTIAGDTGSATGSTITIETNVASLNSGSSVSFVGSGATLIYNNTDSLGNIILGHLAGQAGITGTGNTGLGQSCLVGLTSGSSNVVVGNSAMAITTGSFNVAIGIAAGVNYTSSESSNIVINNQGTITDSHVIRIGTTGTSDYQQSSCFIAGIAGVTVASTAAVLVNTSTGQLGTIVSSRRVKENIEKMGDASNFIYDLRPVKFTYKSFPEMGLQMGLIAEEVEEVYPKLVSYDEEGLPLTVAYHELIPLLLNEVQKLQALIYKVYYEE